MSDDIIEVGKKYALIHQRFGRASVKVLSESGEWIDVEVLSGVLRGMGRGAVWGPGDVKTVRRIQCTFTPLAKP